MQTIRTFLNFTTVAAISAFFLAASNSYSAFAVNVPKKIQPRRVQSAPTLRSTSVSASGPNVPQKVREAPKQTPEEYQEQLDEAERLRILREYWEIMYSEKQ